MTGKESFPPLHCVSVLTSRMTPEGQNMFVESTRESWLSAETKSLNGALCITIHQEEHKTAHKLIQCYYVRGKDIHEKYLCGPDINT